MCPSRWGSGPHLTRSSIILWAYPTKRHLYRVCRFSPKHTVVTNLLTDGWTELDLYEQATYAAERQWPKNINTKGGKGEDRKGLEGGKEERKGGTAEGEDEETRGKDRREELQKT